VCILLGHNAAIKPPEKEIEMKKEHKIVTKAKELKKLGYTHIASIVKQHYASSYYHVVSIDSIIEAGKWIPAPTYSGSWHGKIGIIGTEIDWSKTAKRASI